MLAEIVRLDRDHHRQIAGDTALAGAVKLLARAHQTAIWERTRQVLRLRSTLLQFFPSAIGAFPDLSAKDSLILLALAPSPARAAELTRSQVVSALRSARRHHVEDKADALLASLRRQGLQQPPTVAAAFAAIVAGQVVLISALNTQIEQLQEVVAENFDLHPAAEIYLSQSGLGHVLAARVLGEFGDDRLRFTDARARKNYSGQSPITRASGKKTVVLARFAKNNRLSDALHFQAMSSMKASPGAARTTTPCEPGTSGTMPPCGSWPTGWSASCTAASRPERATTRTPPGTTTNRSPSRSNRQDLWMKNFLGDQDFFGLEGGLGRSFDEFPVMKRCPGSDQGDELGGVDRPPPGLRRFDQLERHRQTGRAGTRPLRDLGAVPHGGKRGLEALLSSGDG